MQFGAEPGSSRKDFDSAKVSAKAHNRVGRGYPSERARGLSSMAKPTHRLRMSGRPLGWPATAWSPTPSKADAEVVELAQQLTGVRVLAEARNGKLADVSIQTRAAPTRSASLPVARLGFGTWIVEISAGSFKIRRIGTEETRALGFPRVTKRCLPQRFH
jgi:hypothetical protein